MAGVFALSHLVVKALGRHGVQIDPYVVRLVDLDQEGNLPAFVAACQLILAGLIGLVLARAEAAGGEEQSGQGKERDRPILWILRSKRGRCWLLLGIGMLVMGVDEAVQFHEQGNRLANQSWVPDSVWLRYAWVLPGLVVVAICGLSMVGFLRQLPVTVARNLVMSGAVYVGGALGCELLGSYVASHYSRHSINYAGMVAIEETAEFLGIALYVRACLSYAETRFGELRVGWHHS